jgi:hypothetical protein
VSILVSGVIDTADQGSAVSLTPLTTKKSISWSNISANTKPYAKRL